MVSDGGGDESRANLGWNSLVAEKTEEQKKAMHGETIRTVTLDEYVNTHHITCIDAMKIDTEGFEANVAQGLRRALQEMAHSDCMPVLFIEIGWGTAPGTRKDYQVERDMFATLQNLGYELPAGINDVRGTSDVVLYPRTHRQASMIL